MTEIFVLMWLSDVSAKFDAAAVGALVVLGISLFLTAVAAVEGDANFWDTVKRMRYWYGLIALVLFVSVALPSKTTLRIAAAGMAGVELSKTETAQKAVEAIHAVLENIIKEAKK